MPTVQANGITLYYETHGAADAPPLLLINGVGQWHAAWWRNIGPLAEHFHVITFDNRGIGQSDKPDGVYTLDNMADDALGLLDALGIARAHVLGHSLGGGIALFMARKQAARIGKLILASTLYWGPKVVMPSPRAMQALQDRSGDPLELVRRGIRIATADGFEARDPDAFQKLIDLRFQSQQTPDLYLKQSSAGLPYLQADHIADFTPPNPVLLIVGEHDEVAPRGNSDAIAAAWPGARVVEIAGAGHLFNIEQPDATHRAIIDFLTAADTSAAPQPAAQPTESQEQPAAMSVPTLLGVTAQTITTDRLSTRVLFTGPDDGTPVLFIHGNASSATFWEEIMLGLPAGFRGIAPDLRGYGGADRAQKIDATRGLGDWADDLRALLDHLGLEQVHVAGHSLGGAVIWRMLMDYPQRLQTVTLVAPGSPFGFGGTKDLSGTPSQPDFAGSGGGTVNPEFARLMGAGDRGSDNPQASPRVVMNSFYWKPPFIPAREEDLLSSLLSEHIGPEAYPGDMVPSANWPMVAPGVWGPINAISPKYADDVQRLYAAEPKPPVLWVRGSDDQVVSDTSFFDLGTLGSMGLVPGWPGADVYPSQPMVGQTRAVLEQYAAAGGSFREEVIADTGHTPFIEQPDAFNALFHAHIKS